MTGSPNADKTLSMAGLAFIKNAEEEGGKPKLKAYDDGTGTWTIGFGCTEGVTRGMVITAQQAMDMLDHELEKHITAVRRLIKVPISQGLFDALVSFFFNCGSGKCQTLLSTINDGGTDDQIRKAFLLYTKAYDANLKQTVTWPGLVHRRTIEIQHWAKMDEMDPSVPTPEPPVRVPAPIEPTASGWVSTAVQSKSFMMQAQAFCAAAALMFSETVDRAVSFVSGLIGIIPATKDEIKSIGDSASQLAGYLQTNAKRIVVPLVMATLVIAAYRHIRDKREQSK